MRLRIRTILCCTAIFSAVSFFTITFAETNPLSKAQVADRIRKVENGVDDFEKYLTTRGENAKDQAGSAKSSGAAKRGQGANSANKDARKDQAGQSKDDLQNAMDDLNRTTNRLRRKFDETANYLETKVQMEQVMDSARRVNQVVAKEKGSNDSTGTTPLDCFAREYQRPGALLQPDPRGRIGNGIPCRVTVHLYCELAR